MKSNFLSTFFLIIIFSFRLLCTQPENVVYNFSQDGNHEALKELLSRDTGYSDAEKVRFLNFQDHDGNTALHIATINIFYECVEALVYEKNTDVNIKNNKDLAPFIIAIAAENNAIVNCFLKRNDLDVNTTAPGDMFFFDENERVSPLFTACDTGNKELVSKLLRHQNIDLSLKCAEEYFYQRIVEVGNVGLLQFVLENERSGPYLEREKNLLINSFVSLQNCDLSDKEIVVAFKILVDFCSTNQLNATCENHHKSIIHYIINSDFKGLKIEFINILLERNDVNLTLFDNDLSTSLDVSFYGNEPEVLKQLFRYCLNDPDAAWKLANHMLYRGRFPSYQEHTFKQKNWSLFFTLLFNSFCSLGLDGLNKDVSGCNCNICFSPLTETGDDGRHSFVVKIECGHLFGLTCLSEWIKINSACPDCEEIIFSPTLFDSCEVWFPVSNDKESLDLMEA